jgi:hypothetical protein
MRTTETSMESGFGKTFSADAFTDLLWEENQDHEREQAHARKPVNLTAEIESYLSRF